MRKYIVGALFGFVLAFTVSAHAAELKSLVGKVVQGEFVVKINGSALDKKAIVIDGSSYLPLKDVGDAFGLDATFNKETGIELKKKETETMTAYTDSETPISEQIDKIDEKIKDANGRIEYFSKGLASSKLHNDAAGIESYTNTINDFKSMIADLESQKAALQQ